MITYTLLVNTKYFPDRVKNDLSKLTQYIIDYADYSTLLLEQLGVYRYRIFNTLILGWEYPEEIYKHVSTYNSSCLYYCNEKRFSMALSEMEKVYKSPEQFAIILYDCHQ